MMIAIYSCESKANYMLQDHITGITDYLFLH